MVLRDGRGVEDRRPVSVLGNGPFRRDLRVGGGVVLRHHPLRCAWGSVLRMGFHDDRNCVREFNEHESMVAVVGAAQPSFSTTVIRVRARRGLPPRAGNQPAPTLARARRRR